MDYILFSEVVIIVAGFSHVVNLILYGLYSFLAMDSGEETEVNLS